MRAGQLKHRVKIEKVTTAKNAIGEDIETWSELVTVWARIVPSGGREFDRAAVRFAELRLMLRIRYRSDVSAQHRIIFRGRTFDIMVVESIEEADRDLRLLCKETI